MQWEEFDSEWIRGRIDQIEPKLCTAELRTVLPQQLFNSLAENKFEPLRFSLKRVFAHWL